MNWRQVEAYLAHDDRIVLPIGSTEQHAHLSLATDSILAEKVALEAAEPLGVPVLPALPFGITPYFLAFPGTISLKLETYGRVLMDVLESLAGHGFRRILIVNGHGGNQPAQAIAADWQVRHPTMTIKLHNWWNAPQTMAAVHAVDPIASHASWMENFPWTRLPDVVQPKERKPMVDLDRLRMLPPPAVRDLLGDGNYGGYYERDDALMLGIWQVAVEETRALLEGPWA